MTVTFIGDVHGWSKRLDAVLAQAEGEIVLMGDLVDRGPDAPGVLERVRAGCRAGTMRCLLGNHEYALLRGLGAPTRGINPDAHWFELWRDRHGGKAVLESYRAGDARTLRRALGADMIDWLASLPWYLEDAGWIAVHASMRPGEPLPVQIALLQDGWHHLRDQPDHLYDKAHVLETPDDLPEGCVLVSGHLPLPEAIVTPRRILCDTTGGLPGRRLSGVIWPEGRIITS
jgi:serine/threonine protein phosphatase 1